MMYHVDSLWNVYNYELRIEENYLAGYSGS